MANRLLVTLAFLSLAATTQAQPVGPGPAPALPLTGGALSGLLTTAPPVAGGAGLNLPPGVAPSSPNNGDLWTTSAGIYVEVGGSPVGPLSSVTSVLPGATTSQLYGGSGAAETADVVSLGAHLSIGSATLSTDATAANTASTIMARDSSGQVAAETFVGALTGTASNASELLTATWASPAAIGSMTPAAGSFAGLTATSSFTATGLVTAADLASGAAASNLGFTPAASGANSDIKSLAGLTTALSVPQGGTGGVSFTSNLPLIGNTAGALAQGTRSGSTTDFATINGTLISGHCVSIDANLNLIDAGGACTTGGGGGTVNSGTAGQLAYYGSTGTVVSGDANATISSGAETLGVAASVRGSLILANSTAAGLTTLATANVSASSYVLTLPAITDTLVTLTATQTLTNKSIAGSEINSSLVAAAYGGSGISSPTAHSLLQSEGSSAFSPITAATAGKIVIDQGSGSDWAAEAVSGDAALAANGALTVTKTSGAAFGALATLTPGTNVATALGDALNGASGLASLNGSITSGNCLKWSSTGIQDAGATCGSGGGGGGNGGLFVQEVNPTGTNTFPALSNSYTTGLAGVATLIVNGVSYTDHDDTPFFSVSGTTITWISATAGFSVTTADSATIVYTSNVASSFATAAQVQTGTSTTTAVTPSALSSAQAAQTVTESSNTATVNWQSGFYARVQLNGNLTSLTLSNPVDGGQYNLDVKQPSSGGPYTVTWPSSVDWGAAGAPTLSVAASVTDQVIFKYNSSTSKYQASVLLGF